MKHERTLSPPPGQGQVGFPRMWKRAIVLAVGAGTLFFLAHHYGGDSYFKWRAHSYREYTLELLAREHECAGLQA